MAIRILKAGLNTTVQDFGRIGYLSSGITPSGAMDQPSLALANLLVGNSMRAAGLEFCMQGPKLFFQEPAYVAVTGGVFPILLNGASVPAYTTLVVQAGDTMEIGFAGVGNYGYLAFGGQLDIPPVMGSLSTNVKCALGGLNGQKLKDGDELPLGNCPHLPIRAIQPPAQESGSIVLWVVPGPQRGMFTDAGWHTFVTQMYQVTTQIDRMGIRLDGPKIESVSGTDIISDGTAFGAIQVPGSGCPIVLMADRQTAGGYAKIGVVSSVTLPLLAQARPGTQIQFSPVTVEQSQQIYVDYWRAMEAFANTF